MQQIRIVTETKQRCWSVTPLLWASVEYVLTSEYVLIRLYPAHISHLEMLDYQMMSCVCSSASFSLFQPEVRDFRQVPVTVAPLPRTRPLPAPSTRSPSSSRSGPLPRGSARVLATATAPAGSFQITPRASPTRESSSPVLTLNLRRLFPARRRWDRILPSSRTVGVFCLCPENLRPLSKTALHILKSVFARLLFSFLKTRWCSQLFRVHIIRHHRLPLFSSMRTTKSHRRTGFLKAQ